MRRNSHQERALWGRLHSNRRRVFLKRLSCAPQQAKAPEQIDQAGAVVDRIQEERETILTVLGPLFLFPQRGGWKTAELLDWATENLLVEVHRNRCLDRLYMPGSEPIWLRANEGMRS